MRSSSSVLRDHIPSSLNPYCFVLCCESDVGIVFDGYRRVQRQGNAHSESEELHEQGNERAEAVPGVLLQPSQIPDRPRVEAEQQSERRLI